MWLFAGAATCGESLAADWPQWCGGPSRNAVSPERNLPETFDPGRSRKWGDANAPFPPGRNVRWKARLGFQTFSSPVVAEGRILIGTTWLAAKDPTQPYPRGTGWLLCLDERTGRKLWDLLIPRRMWGGGIYPDGGYGVCSTPTIVDGLAYLVSNRGEVLCLDLDGQANGNDGPFTDEGAYLSAYDAQVRHSLRTRQVRPTDGDIVWAYDMLAELKICPQDASCCSPLVHGRFVYVCTGNGVNAAETSVPYPSAPSLIALDRRTGHLAAVDAERIGAGVFKGQWSSPALCRVNGRELIILGGGDGRCYAFRPVGREELARGTLAKVWSVDCNPPAYRWRDGKPVAYQGRSPGGPSEIIATPACRDGRVYVAIGRDPVYRAGPGNLLCIDAAEGRIRWSSTAVGRSVSSVAVAGGLVYAAETAGKVLCLDADTGKLRWALAAPGPIWSSPLAADGKVFIGCTKGLLVLAAGTAGRLLGRIDLPGGVYAAPCAANGVLYVAASRALYAATATAPLAAR